ncbi:hypothetical protein CAUPRSCDRAFT_13284 [Caulochytrium protostelioides]|nr:hypothetical protein CAUPRSCDRAFT_13284 [Caulochytrium protostelioides]
MLSGPSPRIPSVRPMPLPRVSSNQGNGTPATLAALLGPAMAGVMAPSTAAAGGLGNVLGPGGAAGQGAVTLSLATARLLATQLLTARHQTLEEALFRAQAVLRAGWTPSVSALPALLRRPPGAAAVEADAAVVAATDRATLKVMRQSHRVGRGGLMALRAQYALPAAPEGPDSASADRTLASQLETLATRLQTAQSRWWQQWRTLTRQCEANQRRMARVLHQASAVIARESEASASTSASASTAPSATSSSSASRWSRRIETLQQQWDATVRAYEADTTRLSQGALRAKRAVMAGLGLA